MIQKREKILIILITASVFLVGYMIMTAKKIDNDKVDKNYEIAKNKNSTAVEKVDLVKLENDYKIFIKDVYKTIVNMSKDISNKENRFATEKIVSSLNKGMLEVKVPEKFKKLHMNLFMAVKKINSILSSDDIKEKEELFTIINNTKIANSWIADYEQ